MDTLREWLSRLETELLMAEGYLEVHPDTQSRNEVEKVRSLLAEHEKDLSPASIKGFVMECEGLLRKTSDLLKAIDVHLVAHAHIDMNWTWAYDETVAVAQDTFHTMLMLMEKYPEFTFSQSQAAVYRIVEEFSPQMLEEIRKRIAEGRWEISSCTWVEGDKNMSSGESQVRQVLYAKRYFNRLFGLSYDDIKLDFEPDTFGHTANIPATLSKLGVRYYYHTRGFKGPKIYRWQAACGDESLICYLERDDWYSYGVEPDAVTKTIVREIKETGMKDVLRVYGVGDHGGGPTVRDIENIRRIASWPVYPTIKFSTYRSFFEAIEASCAQLPVVTGEHNCVFTGCYTSQSEIKKANRLGERYLMEAEAFSALASKETGFAYPTEILNNAWEKHLFNQFHDILPGSGVRDTREFAMGKFQEIVAATSSVKKQALRSIADAVDTVSLLRLAGIGDEHCCDRALGAGVGFSHEYRGLSASSVSDGKYRIFTVFNPSPFNRSEVVEAFLWDMKLSGGLVVKNSKGEEVQFQIVDPDVNYWGHEYTTILFEAIDVPPLGYKSFIVYDNPSRPRFLKKPHSFDERLEEPFPTMIENEYMSVTLDCETGALKSLILKDGSIELVPEGQRSAAFRIIDESTSLYEYMTAWIMGTYAGETPVDHVKFRSVDRPGRDMRVPKVSFTSTKGTLRNGLVWTMEARSSKLTVGMYLDKRSRALRIDCKCDWLEQGSVNSYVPQLNVIFQLPLENARRLYEVPFGVAEREAKDMDVPALRWADISGSLKECGRQAGLTIATDSKYGFRGGDDSLAVSLIRGTYDPDPYPEYGDHRFSIAAIPHLDACKPHEAYTEAAKFDQPLTVFQTTAHAGELPVEKSFVEIRNDNVILSSLKKAEDGEGLILRVYEIAGQDTEAEFVFGNDVSLTEVDGMERATRETVYSSNGVVTYRIPANSIRTLLIETQTEESKA